MMTLAESEVGAAAHHACNCFGTPCLLVIRSARQSNVKADIKSVRIQILQDAGQEDPARIGMATLLRRAQITDSRRVSLARSMNRRLQLAASRVAARRGRTLKLDAFRHPLSTRVRMAMGNTAAAALTGTARAPRYIIPDHSGSFRRADGPAQARHKAVGLAPDP